MFTYSSTLNVRTLQESKVEAIERIGFGRTGKVFLEFERPFWCAGEEVMKVAWGRKRMEKGSKKGRGEWLTSVLGFDEVVGNPRVLVCWLSGAGVPVMEELSEEEVGWMIAL